MYAEKAPKRYRAQHSARSDEADANESEGPWSYVQAWAGVDQKVLALVAAYPKDYLSEATQVRRL